MTVVVLGATGQLGQAIVARFSPHHRVIACTRQHADVTRPAELRAVIVDRRPDAIVNCAAFNNVDGAEDDPRIALDVNAFAVRTLARAAADAGAVLVHYSTDFVFNGATSEPYTEEQRPEPQSVYAQSKLIGEWMAATWPRHYVLRVESLFGGPRARGSVDTIVGAVRNGGSARVFRDRWVSPSYVDDVAEATAFVLTRSTPFGLYHCVNTGVATWLEVGQEVARLLDRPTEVLTPVSVDDVQLRAPRPRFAALSNQKLARAGFTMPTWQDALARYLRRPDA